jgi:UDP-glucose 4-epimerase
VVDALIKEGHEVFVVDNLSRGRKENLNPRAKFYQLDILSPKLEEVFREEGIEMVSHHAAQIDVRRSVASPSEDARINLLGLINLLENCVRYGVRGIVFASSGGVIYGDPQSLPVEESAPKRPLSPYGVSKLSSEYYLWCFAKLYGLPYVSLRYANVYGPRQDPHGEAGVVAIFGEKMLTNTAPTIYGDGEQVRDYVYVEDVARANVLALYKLEESSQVVGEDHLDWYAYNIGTGQPTTVNQLFNLLRDSVGYKGQPTYGPERPGELRRVYLDCSKAFKELGWEPRVSLSEGLRRTVAHLKEAKKRPGGGGDGT